MIVRSPISVGIALIKIRGKHWEWTALTGGAVFCVLLAVIYIIRYAHPRFRRMQFLHDDMNRVMRDNMTGIRVVRAYNAEEYQEGKFFEANDRLTKNGLEAMHAMGVMHPTMRFANNGLTVGIYFLGAMIINQSASYADRLTVFSDMVVFANYASRILFAFMSLNMIFNTIPRATVCAERINEILETDATIVDGGETEGVQGREGEIEFRNVSFRYPGTEGDVLTDISFTAKSASTTIMIGRVMVEPFCLKLPAPRKLPAMLNAPAASPSGSSAVPFTRNTTSAAKLVERLMAFVVPAAVRMS